MCECGCWCYTKICLRNLISSNCRWIIFVQTDYVSIIFTIWSQFLFLKRAANKGWFMHGLAHEPPATCCYSYWKVIKYLMARADSKAILIMFSNLTFLHHASEHFVGYDLIGFWDSNWVVEDSDFAVRDLMSLNKTPKLQKCCKTKHS